MAYGSLSPTSELRIVFSRIVAILLLPEPWAVSLSEM